MELDHMQEYLETILNSPSVECSKISNREIDGYTGTWYSIIKYTAELPTGRELFYLMESEVYGEDAHHLLLNEQLILVAEDVVLV